VSSTKRHLDSAVASKFWSLVDNFIFTKKQFLLPKEKVEKPQAADAQR
jgi:hypothetical protein